MWGPECRQADQGGSVASVWWEAAGARDGFIDGNLKDIWPWWEAGNGVKDTSPACGLGSRVGRKDCWEGHGCWPWGL